MKLCELLSKLHFLQDVEIGIRDESICGKANMLEEFLRSDVLEFEVTNIVAENSELKVWVKE